jgi:excisionase family DNA binding protein
MKSKENTNDSSSGASDDTLLTKFGLAPKLNVSKRTVDAYMKKGWLPYIRLGKTIRFRWGDVLEKLNERRVN